MRGFSSEQALQLHPAEPRKTAQIRAEAPCRACPIRHAAYHAKLGDENLTKLASIAKPILLKRRQMLFAEGESAQHLFSITSGVLMVFKLSIDGRRQITGFLFQGDLLGLSLDGRYTYNAEAIVESTVNQYPVSQTQNLIRLYPEMERRLCKITRQELAEAQEQMLLLGQMSAKERMAAFLLKLARHASDRGYPADEVSMPMTGEMMGDYLGLSKETVSRSLAYFKRKGLISATHGDHVALPNIKALEKVATGLG